MQENHKASIGICSHPEVLNPQCSCGECDSVSCFTKRRADIPCTCDACRKSKSCLFYNTDATEKKSGSINFKDVEIELAIENLTKEFIKKEITYQLDSKNNKRTITKKHSRIRYNAVDASEQLKEAKENNKAVIEGQSAADTHSRKKVIQSTEKLSAQVMDVPYKDFQNSLMPNFPSNVSKISAFDIFNRIKEAYKACSCKVCECIVGKSLYNGQCNCKPCECKDCTSFMKREKSFTTGKMVLNDDEGCPCVRCDRGSCKGIGKKKSGEPLECDCVGLLKSHKLKSSASYSKACNCVPCQCIECKPLSIHRNKAIVVAPVGEENQQRNTCLCSPCECFNCGHGYGISQNLHQEISTSVNRHPNCHCEMCANDACIPDDSQTCRCERQSRVMSKPFQRDSNDYDIRRAIVTYKDRSKLIDDINYDTIAMYAAVTNTYPKVASKKQCDCDKCECLVCKHKANTAMAYNSSNNFDSIIKKCNKTQNDCKCFPCECQFCDKQNIKELHAEKKTANLLCACDVCDCLHCERKARSYHESHEINKPLSKFSVNGDCRCNPCECTDCEKLMYTCIGDICQCINCKCESCIGKENVSAEVIYPVKKGERLTPSIFRNKIKDSFIESCMNTLDVNERILKQPFSLKSSMKKPSAFNSVPRLKIRDDFVFDGHQQLYDSSQPIFSHNFRTTETVKHAQISKCRNGIKLHVDNESMEQSFDPNLSSNSSMSYIKDSGTITPTSKCKHKSWESSCNSSGHDCPSYLIHFPKTTVETCLNDIIQLDNSKHPFSLGSSKVLSSKTKHHSIPMTVDDKNFLNLVNLHEITQTEEGNYFQYSAKKFESKPFRPQPIKMEFTPEQVSKPYSLEKLTSSFRDRIPTNYNKYVSNTKPNNFNYVMLDEDYERVQNTLQEAREFSQQLVKLLEKYEKANKEFESVSEKIKRSNNSLLNSVNKSELVNTDKDFENRRLSDDVPTKEHDLKSSCGSSTQELEEINRNAEKTNVMDFSYEPNYPLEDKNNYTIKDNVLNELIENNQKEIINDEGSIPHNAALLKIITEENDPFDLSHKIETKKKAVKKFKRNYCKMYRRSIVCSKRLKRFTNNSSMEIDATIETEESQPIIEQLRAVSRNKNVTVDYHEIMKVPRTTHDFGLPKQLKKSTTELRVSATEKYAEGRHILQKDVVMIKQPMIEHDREVVEMNRDEQCSVLKKNFFLNSRNESIDSYTLLERNVKATVKSISRQNTERETDTTKFLYENKALMKLHSEVKKLLDMPMLHYLENTRSGIQKDKQDIIYNDLSKTASAQTNQELKNDHSSQRTADMTATFVQSSRKSCDALKVNYLHVRRVSDHTVLVKWNAPRVLDNVVGYELLIDGRAVQKLLSPGCRMAVVTCLPHSDKVLLTVRTVVSPPSARHSPTSTVIYQPKNI